MKICLVQPDVITGNIEANVEKIIEFCDRCAQEQASLAFLPAESIAGPHSEYFQSQLDFGERLANARQKLGQALKIPLVCEFPDIPGPVLFKDGKMQELGCNFIFADHKFHYGQPSDNIEAEFLILAKAAVFKPESQEKREAELGQLAQTLGCVILAPNLSGGYGSFIYNGQSLIMGADGLPVTRGAAFSEDLLNYDCESGVASAAAPSYINQDEAQWLALICGTADFVHKAGADKALLGLSGGMDSALVACIAAEALGAENVTGVLMPSPFTSESSITDAQELAQNLGIQTLTIAINPLLDCYTQTLKPVLDCWPAPANDTTFENLQPRIRGTILMALANRSGALVLNTGNRSEAAMGYCTLYGDTVGALAVIGDLFKSRIYELGEWLCITRKRMIIPENIFDKAPSAELRPDQKDTDSLPPYPELDVALEALFGGPMPQESGWTAELQEIQARIDANRFKRAQCPPVLLVSGLRE